MTTEQGQLDNTIEIVTPENIAFHYRVAGPFRRFVAVLLDVIAKGVCFVVLRVLLGLIASPLGSSVMTLIDAFFVLIWFVLSWFYGALLETFWNGRTIGKWAMGLRVVSKLGEPINGMQAILRNLFKLADMLPTIDLTVVVPFLKEWLDIGGQVQLPLFVVGLITMAMDRRSRRIGDLVAGTMVIVDERTWLVGVTAIEDPRTPHLAELIPADFQVSRSLAQSLTMYVDRRKYFTDGRRREIARHLGEPLVRLFGLPSDTSWDLLLCALYYRTFIADRGDEAHRVARDESPFGIHGLGFPTAVVAAPSLPPATGSPIGVGPQRGLPR